MKYNTQKNIYKQTQRFAEITKTLIMIGNINRAKHCLQIAENIYKNGSSEIKNVIINVYVFSVSSFMEIHHCNIRNLFPQSLHLEYQKQVKASGI